jgi:hypothetical protein
MNENNRLKFSKESKKKSPRETKKPLKVNKKEPPKIAKYKRAERELMYIWRKS